MYQKEYISSCRGGNHWPNVGPSRAHSHNGRRAASRQPGHALLLHRTVVKVKPSPRQDAAWTSLLIRGFLPRRIVIGPPLFDAAGVINSSTNHAPDSNPGVDCGAVRCIAFAHTRAPRAGAVGASRRQRRKETGGARGGQDQSVLFA